MNPEESSPAVADGAVAPFIVGIGASAGGLEALERLFEAMPTDTGMAFVVVQHLSPDFKSLTDDILARRTRLPIRVVEDGIPVRPDTIFLIPPRKDMIATGGRLLLTDKDPGQVVALPIDRFLRSLASEAGDRGVAVILSGTGSDGSRGIREVHEAGGLVVVQEPGTAKFDGMPRSAIDTGAVDLVLAPEAIPDALMRHARHPRAVPATPVPMPVGVDAVFRLLRDAHGIDFSYYKPDTVARRLERRLSLCKSTSVEEYARRLAEDPAELNLLYKDLLIGVTRFFRDEEAFARLAADVLPGLVERLGPGEEFRAWVTGCATGEEAYSLAILVRECLDGLGRDNPVKIFATDAHRASLDTAGVGVYPEAALAEVGAERLSRFFARVAGGYQVSADLRKMVVFAAHNVLKDAPFTRLDLVTCRNLLIYFQPAAQKRVLTLFHFALKTGGVLFLGPSETCGEVGEEFEPVDHRWKVYRKRRDVRLAADLRPPAAVPPRTAAPAPPGPDPGLPGLYDALLDEFMPPSLLVNDRGEVIQAFAGASKYLRFRDGRVNTDVLAVVDPELRTALVGALPRAFKELAEVTYKGLRVSPPEGERLVDMTVRPVRNRRAGVGHALIQLREVGGVPPAREAAREIDLGEATREQVLSLEAELRYTKENLQAVVEEMETSNEELQATNEELVAANEELQSTNEELQSTNEELYTVNGEYQKKIAELTELTADMDNLLTSAEVHTIFLGRDLCIRKFTPKIAETFNLLPQDLGRRIDHFTYTLDHPGLLDDLRAVLAKASPIERQVRDRQGRWFLLRVLPYRAGLSVAGVVVTLIDLSRVKQAEAERWRIGEQLSGVLRNAPDWIAIRDPGGRYALASEAFKRFAGCDPVGRTAHDLFPAEVAEAVAAADRRVIDTGEESRVEVQIPHPDGPHTYLSVNFPIRDEAGRVTAVGGIKTDITPIKQAERLARDGVIQRDRFLAMLSHELRNPLAAVLNAVTILTTLSPKSRGAPLDPELARWLPVIERRARHMARLLDDLLDVSRFTQNKVILRRSRFDLGKLIRDVVEGVRPWFDEARVELTQGGPDRPLVVDGDPDRLQQVQVNILRNAAKYTPAGGRVWYTVGREDGRAVIRVRDTGVGLSREMIGKVFDPFTQADETLDRAGGGIGVGLTLARTIVEMHGGTVEAHSDGQGKGSEFVVRLPLDPADGDGEGRAWADGDGKPHAGGGHLDGCPARPGLSLGGVRTQAAGRGAVSHNPAEPPAGTVRPLRLLVVEDDADIRSSLVGLLDMGGHTVRAVGDGPAALAALDAGSFDAVLLDIGLPGMSGYELAAAIRARPGPTPPLVALTGYGRPEDRAAAAAAGIGAHLTKPFRPDELDRLLESLPPAPGSDGSRPITPAC
jgi:two-component system CheB/CheR fusion protein